jgi:acetyl esterase/lipase
VAAWLFLVVACWGACWTVVSFRPPQRPGWLMVAGFFAAWSTTELAPLHLFWQAIAVLAFVAVGALREWPGWVGLGITVVSWLGLTTTVRGALQTDRAFEEALCDALGPDAVAALPDGAHPLRWTRILAPLWFKRPHVRRIRDLQYVDDGRRRHRLDIYRAAHTPPGAPVLLQIHGGGWMIGNKDQQGLPLMYHLAARGWVCVAINYRLSPRGTWPDHLVDCKRALAWIRTHIAEYGGDPQCVVVTGGSAGGHLAAMVGLTANDPAFQPGFEDADTTVRAMIPVYGVFDWTGRARTRRDEGLRDVLERYIVKRRYQDAPELYAAASPLSRVHADAPPALVIHGELDTLAPVAEARAFVAALRATGRAPVVYVELRGAHHAFEVFNSIRTMHTLAGVDLFLSWLLSAGTAPGVRGPGAGAPTRAEAAGGAASDRTPTAHTARPPSSRARAARRRN